jgi:hypothetical protein
MNTRKARHHEYRSILNGHLTLGRVQAAQPWIRSSIAGVSERVFAPRLAPPFGSPFVREMTASRGAGGLGRPEAGEAQNEKRVGIGSAVNAAAEKPRPPKQGW